jgi:hypothetical protein
VRTLLSETDAVLRSATDRPEPASGEAAACALAGGGGTPLPAAVRAYFEPRFGRDFSAVRTHTGPAAAAAAEQIDAHAFTLGRDIAFSHGAFSPATAEGRRLIAHELAHVVQQEGGAPPVVQRDINPPRSAPVSGTNLLGALLPQIPPELSKQFIVRAMKETEFQAMTGIKASSIPEKRLLSPKEAGIIPDAGSLAGTGAGTLFAPPPTLPLSLGTTGVLWSADAHLSQFAVVPQENPALAFFFGDTTMNAYGFRANAPLHFGAATERLFDPAGGPLTAMLNRGAAGNYVNDAIYPYVPVKGGSVAIHVQGGGEKVPGAQELVACMAEANRSGRLQGTYRFSTPPRNPPAIAFNRAFGGGKAADPSFEAPEIVNCLNKANELTRKALQGRDLTLTVEGRQVNLSTGTFVDTGERVPDMLPSAAKSMRPYLAQWDVDPAAQGLTRTPITGGMWLRGATGVLRIGGFVLMIFNLARVYSRYELASEYEQPLVVGEEATQFTAGLLGSLIGEAIGEAVICVGTGPGFGLCVLATAALGGVVAGAMSEDTAKAMGKTLQDAAELNRQGKLLPGILEAGTQVLGNERDKRIFQEMKKTEKPQQSRGLLDLFDF